MNANILAVENPLKPIVDGGYCIGCGVCSAVEDSPIKIKLNEFGKYQAEILSPATSGDVVRKLAAVCPFSDAAPNEQEIGYSLFSEGSKNDDKLGYWRECYIGHVGEGEYRANGSSGGFVSWLICELMSKGIIDGVMHVVPSTLESEGGAFFKYGVSTTISEVTGGAKSRYYGVEMSQAIGYVRDNPGRYLVVGVPCFVKAIRLLSREEKIFSERIVFSVAILCGHLKSIHYLEFIAWQLGVPLNEIHSFDFRHKIPSNPAKNYAVQIVRRKDGIEQYKSSLMSDLKGEDWGMGLFKYSACDYCDDVMGETADVSAGDAWIEPYSSDSKGTNVIVVRNEFIHKIIETGKVAGRLALVSIPPEIANQTQEASFRHRRDGLSYRLWLKQKLGVWVPKKRVEPKKTHLSRKYRRIFELRSSLVSVSDNACLVAIKNRDFGFYWPNVKSSVRQYHRVYHPLWIAIPRKVWRICRKMIKNVGA